MSAEFATIKYEKPQDDIARIILNRPEKKNAQTFELLAELNHLILEKINRIDGVLRTETEMFLNYIKRQYDWGTALD